MVFDLLVLTGIPESLKMRRSLVIEKGNQNLTMVGNLIDPKLEEYPKLLAMQEYARVVCACEIIFLHFKESSGNSGANRTTTSRT